MNTTDKHWFSITRKPVYSAPGVVRFISSWAQCVKCDAEFEVTDLNGEPFDSGLYLECPVKVTALWKETEQKKCNCGGGCVCGYSAGYKL